MSERNLRAPACCILLLSSALFCAGQNSRTNLESYLDFATRQEGVVARGRELFNDEQRTACTRCHTVDGSNRRAGPDLSFIGDKFPRRDLITSVLEPSANIAVGYDSTTIATGS